MIPTTLVKDRNGNWSPRRVHGTARPAPADASNSLPKISGAKSVQALSARTLKEHLKTQNGGTSPRSSPRDGIAIANSTHQTPTSAIIQESKVIAAGSWDVASPHSSKGSASARHRPAPPPPKSTLTEAERSIFSHKSPSKLNRVEKLFIHYNPTSEGRGENPPVSEALSPKTNYDHVPHDSKRFEDGKLSPARLANKESVSSSSSPAALTTTVIPMPSSIDHDSDIPPPKFSSFNPRPASNRYALYDYGAYNNVPVYGLVNWGIDNVKCSDAKLVGKKYMYVSPEQEESEEIFAKEMANRKLKKTADARAEMDELDKFDEKIFKATQLAEEQAQKQLEDEENMRIRAQNSLRGSFAGTSVAAVLGRNNNLTSAANFSSPATVSLSNNPYGNFQMRNTTTNKSIVGSRSPSRARSMSTVGGNKTRGGPTADALTLDSSPHRYRKTVTTTASSPLIANTTNVNTNNGENATMITSTSSATAAAGGNIVIPKGAFSNPNTKIAVPIPGDVADAKRLETGTYLSNLLAKLPLDEILKVYMLVVCGVGKRAEHAAITLSPLTAASYTCSAPSVTFQSNNNEAEAASSSATTKAPRGTSFSARQGSMHSMSSSQAARTAANVARASVVRDESLNIHPIIATDSVAVADFGNGLGSSTFTAGLASSVKLSPGVSTSLAPSNLEGVLITKDKVASPTVTTSSPTNTRKRGMSMGANSAKDDPVDAIQTQQELRKMGLNNKKNANNNRASHPEAINTKNDPEQTDDSRNEDEEEDEELVGIPQLVLDLSKARIALLGKEQKASGLISVINSLQQAAIAGNLTAAVAAANASNQATNLGGTLSGTSNGGNGGSTTIGGSTNSIVGTAGFAPPPISAPSMGFDLFYLFIKTCERYQDKLQSAGTTQPVLVNEVAAEVLEHIDLDDQERDPLLVRVLSNINRRGSVSTSSQPALVLSPLRKINSTAKGNVGISIFQNQNYQDENNNVVDEKANEVEDEEVSDDEEENELHPFGKALKDPPAHSDAYWAQIRKEQLEAERREAFEKKGFEGIASESLSVVKGFPSSTRFVRIWDALTEIGRSRSSPQVQRRINFFVEMFLPRRQWPVIGPHNDAPTNMYFRAKEGGHATDINKAHQQSNSSGPLSSDLQGSNNGGPKAQTSTTRVPKSPSSTKPAAVSPAAHNANRSPNVTPKSPVTTTTIESQPQGRMSNSQMPLHNTRPSAMYQVQQSAGGPTNNSVAGQQRRQTSQQVLSSVPANIFTAEFIIRFVSDFLMPKQQMDESMRLHRRPSHATVLSFFNNPTTTTPQNTQSSTNLVGGGVLLSVSTSPLQQGSKKAGNIHYGTEVKTKASEDDYYRELEDNGLWSPSINSWLILANQILLPLAELMRIKHEWFINKTYHHNSNSGIKSGDSTQVSPTKTKRETDNKTARDSTMTMPNAHSVSRAQQPPGEVNEEETLRNKYLQLLTTDPRFQECNSPKMRELLIRSIDPFEALLQCSISTLSSNHLSSSQQAQVTAANTQAAIRVNAGAKTATTSISAPGYMPASFLNPFQLAFEADHEQSLSLAKNRNIQQYLSLGGDNHSPTSAQTTTGVNQANNGRVPLLPVKTISEDAAKAMCFAVPVFLHFFENLASW